MSNGIGASVQGLHPGLLGQRLERVLTASVVAEDLEVASRSIVGSLQSLLKHSESESSNEATWWARLNKQAERWRSLILGESPLVADRALDCQDFVAFVALLRGLEHRRDQVESVQRLEHMLALGALRLKLEPEPGLVQARHLNLQLNNPGFVVSREIAAACQLRESTVKNALSRRELALTAGKSVALEEALDWMIQRRGFLYPMINVRYQSRRINGRIAHEVLRKDPRAEWIRHISRLRLSEWRLQDDAYRFVLNSQGVHQCQIMLPGLDGDILSSLGMTGLMDRSSDTQARLYRESLALKEGVTLWQGTVPTMKVLDALLDYLVSVMTKRGA